MGSPFWVEFRFGPVHTVRQVCMEAAPRCLSRGRINGRMHRKDLWTDEIAFPPTIPLLALSSLLTCLPHTERKFTSIKTSLPIFPSVEPDVLVRKRQGLVLGLVAP